MNDINDQQIPQVGDYWYCKPIDYDYDFLVNIIEVLEGEQFRVSDGDGEIIIISRDELFWDSPSPTKIFEDDSDDDDLPW